MSSGWGPPASRPPWWPENRPWPPRRGWRRRGGPPGFVWRFGCLALLLLFGLAFLLSVALNRIGTHFGPLIGLSVLILLFVLVATAAARGLRGFARPMDDLIDAAGRIERGDYSAQIREEGPRQLRSVARAFNSMSARLKSTDEQRRDFLADMVHELRTPLAVIRAEAEAIQDGVHPPDKEHIAPIVDATQTLEVLVEDLPALALTDTGSLALHREPVDLGELARDTAAGFETQAEAVGVKLSVVAATDAPSADVDPVRIRSALANLVGNAIRHTPRDGSVTISTARAGDRVALEVRDDGEGIPPDLLPHVFERFVRGSRSNGSGLGLAIAHDIVVAHGGQIEVKSTVGVGTVVRMTLPSAG